MAACTHFLPCAHPALPCATHQVALCLPLCWRPSRAGYVRTDMTGHAGLIDTRQCVEGLLRVLEGKQELNGRWFDYKGQEIPW